ncbi:MAG: ABC transporter ATP-binding protein [Spirochaetes bacterium]|nr:ABC transporter ATP-binding protein [Spirochaetota bacterium]
MSELKLISVTKRFNQVVAVNKLNLEVKKGECFSFLGPSGCGKTTTLRMIAGFEDLDEGELLVDGEVYSSSYKRYYLPPERRDFGMVFQAFAVWPHLTVWDNVAFPLQIRRIPKVEMEKRVKEALQSTGLSAMKDLYPSKLSGGEQQRIALARAVAINPKVMLLDEPLSNLDPKLREEMRFEIKDLQRRFGFTILYVTHDQAEAMALSDRMLVMNSGVVQQIGKPLEIYNEPANKFVFSFIGLSNFLKVRLRQGKAYPLDLEEGNPISHEAPSELGDVCYAAFRPAEVDLVSGSSGEGIPASVARSTFLGDLVDYRISIGNQEIRVQKPKKNGVLRNGESCRIRINRIHWFPLD